MNTLVNRFTSPVYASLTLRLSLGIVFLWFGLMQLENPAQWLSFLPSWTTTLPISQTSIIYINGLFEILGATLLLLGAYTRLTAFLLGGHLLLIALSIGLTNIGIRDFGLSFATFSLFFLGSGTFSIDTLADEASQKPVV